MLLEFFLNHKRHIVGISVKNFFPLVSYVKLAVGFTAHKRSCGRGNVFTPVCCSRGVSVQEVSVWGSLSRGISVWRWSLSRGDLCPGGICPGGVSVQRVLSRGVSVQRVSVKGGPCLGGLLILPIDYYILKELIYGKISKGNLT